MKKVLNCLAALALISVSFLAYASNNTNTNYGTSSQTTTQNQTGTEKAGQQNLAKQKAAHAKLVAQMIKINNCGGTLDANKICKVSFGKDNNSINLTLSPAAKPQSDTPPYVNVSFTSSKCFNATTFSATPDQTLNVQPSSALSARVIFARNTPATNLHLKCSGSPCKCNNSVIALTYNN